ncbi:MAG TPA: SDR family oxidoreductase [Terriglobia bacterium]|nr:SDR family oxidoreductase [Terriglobia bacterium]
METILITGMSGCIGWNLAQRLKSDYRVYGTYLDHPVEIDRCESLAFDLTNLGRLERLCTTIKPRVIVHTAALSNPDLCETERMLALTLNTFATRELARITSLLGSKLIYLSSDLIFDGIKGMYSEADQPAPMNYYAKTKYLGELETTNNCGNYVVLRLSLVYGHSGGLNENSLERMQRQVREGQKLRLFTDQYRTPIFAGDVVVALERIIADNSVKGLFHLGGPDKMSRFEFGQQFCKAFRHPLDLLVPTSLAEAKLLGRRPRDCSLDSRKATRVLNLRQTPVFAGLQSLC